MTTSLSAVSVQKATKRYGEVYALRDVSLQLQPSQCTLLLGGNGAGKSTLLEILSTLLLPTQGQVLINHQPLLAVDTAWVRKHLGFLGHEPRCYPHLTILENLTFFASLYAIPSTEANTRAHTLLKQLQLTDRAHQQVRVLSRGLLQRVALAKTLIHNPTLLLLDEPYTALDDVGKRLLTQLLAEHKKAGGMSVISSHEFELLTPHCDQALLLHTGCTKGMYQSLQNPHTSVHAWVQAFAQKDSS